MERVIPSSTVRIEDIGTRPEFRRLASLRGTEHDLRYASTNNFAGRVLYPPAWDCGLAGAAATGCAGATTLVLA